MSVMDVELLVAPDCANHAPTAALLRRVLDDLDLADISIATTVIDNRGRPATDEIGVQLDECVF
jgi:hypothetical protein